ncbi:MAG: endolytic transglycosylase MltG [Candidatus Jorgensenbacteria bacterium]|nr:endolytic transglycosylase MltG [Candidatus Jorgensenbacteria bacterium]
MRLLSWLGLVLFFLLCLGYFFYSLQPVAGMSSVKGEVIATSTPASAPMQFKITKGETFRRIGADLSQQNLIRSITVFKFYSLLAGRAQKFQPGLYTLSRSMSIPQIVDVLTEGGKNDVTVTIPEGYTAKDIDTTLRASGVLETSLLTSPWQKILIDYPPLAGANSLEGLLFPDTYRFKLQSTPEEVLRVFFDNFKAKAWPLLDGRNDWYNRLTLASYLEREVKSFDDRRIVAGILFNRLKIKMPLQVDATVSYAKCSGLFINCENIQIGKGDLASASLYNTYQRLGWTPTPIANPGQSSIRAAIDPAATSYLYYLTGKDGTTVFSKTLDGHNENRSKYQ